MGLDEDGAARDLQGTPQINNMALRAVRYPNALAWVKAGCTVGRVARPAVVDAPSPSTAPSLVPPQVAAAAKMVDSNLTFIFSVFAFGQLLRLMSIPNDPMHEEKRAKLDASHW